MIDIENLVFGNVATALRSAFSGVFVSGAYVAAPKTFPAVTLVEVDNSVYAKSQDSSAAENHATVVYEVNAYSDVAATKKAQCKAMMAVIDSQMRSMGFSRIGSGPADMPNADTNVYRMVARYRGVVSAKTIAGDSTKYQIYRK